MISLRPCSVRIGQHVLLGAVTVISLGCARERSEGNVLLVVADDLGVDKVSGYGLAPDPPQTPSIDALIEAGVRFDHAVAYASCSPTRAALLTGRFGRRTGIGRPLKPGDDFDLAGHEVGIPEVLSQANVHAAVVGKWHLATEKHAPEHPAKFGFSQWTITPGNLDEEGYDHREVIVNGEVEMQEGYLTTMQADEAIRLVRELPEPWFVLLTFNAPHAPLHVPPPDLLFRSVDEDSPDVEKYDAMVEAMDAEFGRVLAEIDPDVYERTTTIFLGDNGTPAHATVEPFDAHRAKSTLFEGGTRVPLVAAGHGVVGAGVRVEGLVHVVDLLPTLADLAGVTKLPADLDGTSFRDTLEGLDTTVTRDDVFLEKFAPNGFDTPYEYETVGARDARWRYLREKDGREQLFDLAPSDFLLDGPDLLIDPEEPPSPDALEALDRLRAVVDDHAVSARQP